MIDFEKVTIDIDWYESDTLCVDIALRRSLYSYSMNITHGSITNTAHWLVVHSEDGEMESFDMPVLSGTMTDRVVRSVDLGMLLSLIEQCFAKSAYVRLEDYATKTTQTVNEMRRFADLKTITPSPGQLRRWIRQLKDYADD